ncbi:MAG: FGGY-family carbohydrate kinase, partial [Actinomycetota bacterium]
VPGLAGLGAPFWAPNAKGALTGLSLSTSRAHVVRSVIEGIAAQVTWLARAAGEDLGKPLVRLRVDGGLTRSHVLLQTQADLLQAPIEVYPSPNATALGVAAFAQLGAGGKASLHSWKPSAVIEPLISIDEANERLDAWRTVAQATLQLDA